MRHLNVLLLFVTELFTVTLLAQTPAAQVEELQRQAAQERTASGGWRQVAAIESLNRLTAIDNRPGARSSKGNHNIVAFLDRERFAIADGNYGIRIFSAATGRELLAFGEPEQDAIYSRKMVLSADGNLLSLLPDPEPRIWDTRTGKCVATLPKAETPYTHAAFLPDGRSIATYIARPRQGGIDVWEFTEKGTVSPRTRLESDWQIYTLTSAAPYLVQHSPSMLEIWDASTLELILRESQRGIEYFLFVEPPRADMPGQYVGMELRGPDSSSRTEHVPQFRALSLALTRGLPATRAIPAGDRSGTQGRELRRWPVPIENDGEGGGRFENSYIVSPQHTRFAISSRGRVDFLNFPTMERLSFVTAEGPTGRYDRQSVHFIGENLALLASQRSIETMRVVDVSTGQEVARIPDGGHYPVLSPDGQRLLIRREMVHLPGADQGSFRSLPRPLVILWSRAQ